MRSSKGSTTLGSKLLEDPFFVLGRREEKRREEKRRACCCCKECE
jgi:hypothetical protein